MTFSSFENEDEDEGEGEDEDDDDDDDEDDDEDQGLIVAAGSGQKWDHPVLRGASMPEAGRQNCRYNRSGCFDCRDWLSETTCHDQGKPLNWTKAENVKKLR